MNIPKPLKILLLALTLWQPLYMVAFMVMVFSTIPESFDALMVVHGLTMALSVVLLVVYVIHLFKTDHVRSDHKALWGVALFLGAPIAMPIYWFVHLWPDTRAAGA